MIDFKVPLHKFVIRPKYSDPSVFFLMGKPGKINNWHHVFFQMLFSDAKNLSVAGMPSSVLTDRQPAVAPSNQILEAKIYLSLWKDFHDLAFNFDVSGNSVCLSGKDHLT